MNIKELDIFDVGVNILLCVTELMDVNELCAKWKDIRDELASEWQMRNLDDFERWNFYLFYVVEDKSKIDRSLKYKIEHDTVSSRKIIINREEFAGGNYDALIASYIKYDIGELVDEEHKLDFIINLKSASNLNGNLNCSKELEHYSS